MLNTPLLCQVLIFLSYLFEPFVGLVVYIKMVVLLLAFRMRQFKYAIMFLYNSNRMWLTVAYKIYLYFAEVLKWRDVGKDDSLIFDDSIHDILELKDAKILELESTLISGDTELEDLLKKIIQAEVEYVVITTTTKSLTAGPLCEIKHNIQLKNVSSQDMQGPKKQIEKLETQEDIKNLQKSLRKFVTRFMIQLILLFVILYLKFSSQNVEVVPT